MDTVSNRNKGIVARIFLVGCARSGTTLLQSLLATHSEIHSFPETHFLVGRHRKTYLDLFLRKMQWVSPDRHEKLIQFLNIIQRKDLLATFPKWFQPIPTYVTKFSSVLDGLTTEINKKIWLEKTPAHLFYIPLLEKHIPNVQFIHLVRNGAEVVASLYEVTRKYPQHWGGVYDEDRCINYWNNSLRVTESYKCQPNHLIIRYENLVHQPAQTLEKICSFLGIMFEDTMLLHFQTTASELIEERETWKGNNVKQLQEHQGKFSNIFTPAQQHYILNNLKQICIDVTL